MTNFPIRYALFVSAAGLLLSFLSALQPGRTRAIYPEIMGCETGCEMAAAGWPIPYLVDYPGLSVVGSANLSGALLGEDKFHITAFMPTLVFWMAVSALGLFLGRVAKS